MGTIRIRVRQRLATLAEMTAENRILEKGEVWIEQNASTGNSTGRRKVGTGLAAFNDLPFEPGGTGGGATDLSITNRGASTLDVASSTGADVTLPAATNTQAGLATAEQVAKLEGIAAGATPNASNAQLRDRQTHTGEQAISTITGLANALAGKETAGAAASAVAAHEAASDPHPGYLTPAEGNAAYATAAQGAKADTAIQPGNAALSDAREWSASTISQAEAEAGTATTRRAFTAERVCQAIVAWWNGATSGFGRSWVALADAAAGTAQLNVFTSMLKGLAPASGGGTINFLRADGTWTAPGGVEGIALTVSNRGETATVGNNYVEKAVRSACTVIGVTWELNPTTPSTGGSSAAMAYARRSGTRTNLLTANASLPATTGIYTDVSANLTGNLTLAAGDSVGLDLASVGTGATGLILTVYVRYS